MDLNQKIKEIDSKIEQLTKQLFDLNIEKKRYEKQKKEIEKLTAKADEILNQ